MNTPLVLHIVLWVWLVLAVAALGLFVFVSTKMFEDDDIAPQAAFLLLFSAVIAFCFGSLTLLGHAWTALWLWRIAELGVFALALAFIYFDFIRKKPQPTSPPPPTKPAPSVWPAIGLVAATIFTAALAVASFLVQQAQTLPPVTLPLTAKPLPEPTFGFGWFFALTLIAIATLIFAGFFVREIRQSGPPSFETFPTGLGGDASGWQISPSLTYLVVTILFASFFLSLATHLLPSTRAEDKGSGTESSVSQTEETKSKTESVTKLLESPATHQLPSATPDEKTASAEPAAAQTVEAKPKTKPVTKPTGSSATNESKQ